MSLLADFEQSLMAAIDSDSDEASRSDVPVSSIPRRAYEEYVSLRVGILTNGIVEEPMSKDDLVQQARCLDSRCVSGKQSPTELREFATQLLRRAEVKDRDVWHTRVSLSLANCLSSEAIRETCPYANDAWVKLLTGTGWTGIQQAKLTQIAQNVPQDLSWAGCLDIDGDVSCWRGSGIVQLPASWSCMRVGGSLDLSKNALWTLPTDGLVVGEDLILAHNDLVDLGSAPLIVGHSLDVSHNRLTTWPVNLMHSLVGGSMYLDHNSIECLPTNIDEILSICGTLSLRGNGLQSLPISMQRVIIGGDLDLRQNRITEQGHMCLGMMIAGDLLLDEGVSVSKVLDPLQRVFDTDHISDHDKNDENNLGKQK